MNAPPFPLNPSVGQIAGGYIWNGTMWVCNTAFSGMQIIVQTFLASGVYMPSPGLVSVTAECWGGGGGGGGVGSPSPLDIFAGAGGGSGGYSRKTIPASLVLGGVVVTIGAAGVNGGNTGQAGAGGATTFGALCVANGGLGGWAMYPSVTAPEPGKGAAPGIGDIATPGLSGDSGFWMVLPGAQANETIGTPNGGDIGLGGTVGVMIGGATAVQGPNSLPNTGAGGAGGIINQFATPDSVAGGAGGSGLCVATEFCFGGQSGDCGQARVAFSDCGPGWGDCGPFVNPLR